MQDVRIHAGRANNLPVRASERDKTALVRRHGHAQLSGYKIRAFGAASAPSEIHANLKALCRIHRVSANRPSRILRGRSHEHETSKLVSHSTGGGALKADCLNMQPMNIPLVASEIVARDQHQQSTINRIGLVESILREHRDEHSAKRYQEGKMAGVRLAAEYARQGDSYTAAWLEKLVEDLGE